jgi:glycine hydroxymethyltransferase
VILGNSNNKRKKKAIKAIQYAIFPLSTSNTHLARLPALGIATLEMKLFGVELAHQTVKNAQTAGQYLYENGLKVLCASKGFTMSHQIAVDVCDFGGGKKVAQELEEANIILNKNLLPYDNQDDRDNPSGLRIGFQEVTRLGFKKSDIEYLCDLMLKVIRGQRKPIEVKESIITLKKEFSQVKYGFQSVEEALNYKKEA